MTLIVLTAAIVILTSASFGLNVVRAVPDYEIKHVSHTVEVMSNAHLLINDTIEISGQASEGFLLGFPHQYSSNMLRCIAYDANSRSSMFPVDLDVPLGNRVGFYAVRVHVPQDVQVFSIEFVLSSDLVSQDSENSSLYSVNFPAFLGLTEPAAVFNGSIVLPEGAQYLPGGTIEAFTYGKENLTEFTYDESKLTFALAGDKIQIFNVTSLNRVIRINEVGEMSASDSYYITNNASNPLNFVEIALPPNASNPTAQDQLGRTMGSLEPTDVNASRFKVSFGQPVEAGRSTTFTVNYVLPSGVYITQQSAANNFAVNIKLFQNVNYYVDQASVTFALPEGAKLISFEDTLTGDSHDMDRSVFQETLTINKKGVTSLDSFNVVVTYEYNSLWSAFRPTIWISVLAIVGCVAAVILRRPKASSKAAEPSAALQLRPEYIKSFVDSYEEKMKIGLELDALESKVQKGKLPRRRYKVQRKTLEMRLNALSRNLTDAKAKMRSAGGHHGDLMRQLEVAETEINEAEANIKSIEGRYSRGELSIEAYRKLSGEYQRRKEKAESTINGILLRLREETR